MFVLMVSMIAQILTKPYRFERDNALEFFWMVQCFWLLPGGVILAESKSLENSPGLRNAFEVALQVGLMLFFLFP